MMKSKILFYITIIVFIIYSIWWVYLNRIGIDTTAGKDLFSGIHGLMALWGGILGIYISFQWGGLKSLVGKAIFIFAFGLLLQELGQLGYAYYINILGMEEPPYPSIGDVFYLASIPVYIYGTWLLVKATGGKFSLQKSMVYKLLVVFLPILIVVGSYLLFLYDYDYNWSEPDWLLIFFDVAYPIGQAVYISIALLAYILSRKYLGGYLRFPILLIIFGLILQYVADYMFTYQYHNDTWAPGESNEFIFLLTYFVMAVGLIQFSSVIDKLNSKDNIPSTTAPSVPLAEANSAVVQS